MGNRSSTNVNSVAACQLIANRYELTSELGKGAFCTVYKGRDRQNKKYVAVKLERKNSQQPEVHHEKAIYQQLKDLPGIPRLHGLEECGENYALIIDLLGPSLDTLQKQCGGKFSLKTVLLFAVQAIALLRSLHSRRIVYRDIKPQNFLTAGPRAADAGNIFYIIDFGLASSYWNKNTNEHIAFAGKGFPIGTMRYMSMNSHMGKEQSRRDDLEALGYLLIYFLKGELPWMKQTGKNQSEKHMKVLALKRECDIQQLIGRHPKEFAEFLLYARSLSFEAEPDYQYMAELFKKAMGRFKIQEDNVYDWDEKEQQAQGGNAAAKSAS